MKVHWRFCVWLPNILAQYYIIKQNETILGNFFSQIVVRGEGLGYIKRKPNEKFNEYQKDLRSTVKWSPSVFYVQPALSYSHCTWHIQDTMTQKITKLTLFLMHLFILLYFFHYSYIYYCIQPALKFTVDHKTFWIEKYKISNMHFCFCVH